MHITLLNIFYLGIKEIRSLGRDTLMLGIIVFSFSGQIYIIATGLPQSLNKAPIAIVDEDNSPLSTRIINAFYPPHFMTPVIIDQYAADPGMDAGLYTLCWIFRPIFNATCWLDGSQAFSSMSMLPVSRKPLSATVMCRLLSMAKYQHSLRVIAHW